VLWLYLAKTRAGQNVDAVLSAAKKLDLVPWPGAILSFFLKKTDRTALLEAAHNLNTGRERAQQCEAHFFLAEYELVWSLQATAVADLQEAANTCPASEMEYETARAELKRLGH
jgi:lipoprotein NlpI